MRATKFAPYYLQLMIIHIAYPFIVIANLFVFYETHYVRSRLNMFICSPNFTGNVNYVSCVILICICKVDVKNLGRAVQFKCIENFK